MQAKGDVKLLAVSTNHRKDLLWKPLMRMFRRYLKKDALSLEIYEGIRDKNFNMQGLLFCNALDVPSELSAKERNQMAVLLMVSSHRIVWQKKLIPIVSEMMAPYKKEIWLLFFRMFNETSHKKRKLFFSEPIIKVLWEKFRMIKANDIRQYLCSISNSIQPHSQQK